MIRCVRGSYQVGSGVARHSIATLPGLECVTFSVVPKLTGLWSIFIRRPINTDSARIAIGDCSGGLEPFDSNAQIEIFPLLNYDHGIKLDLFLKKVCRAQFVVVSDDDVFWMDSEPWEWARSQFQADPGVAVVSLMPRDRVSSVLAGKVDQPMGSYCLVLRRDIWLKEELSFEIVYPPKDAGYDWFYDTGDYAHLQLLERGYKVIIAPPEIRDHLVSFEGISSWTLKIQKNSGRILSNIAVDPSVRPEKALRTIYVSRGLADLIRNYFPNVKKPYLTGPEFLDRAEEACAQFIPPARMEAIKKEIEAQVLRLRERLETPISEKQP